jgi:hypothetical protein
MKKHVIKQRGKVSKKEKIQLLSTLPDLGRYAGLHRETLQLKRYVI